MRVVALVDGEHYPPVTRWGLATAASAGHEVLGAVFLGGTEKIGTDLPDVGVELVDGRGRAMAAVGEAIERFAPEALLDLSDEPVLGYRERMELVAVALSRSVTYLGADFRFDPPLWAAPPAVASIAVIGTGKRTGKTAVAGEIARVAARMGRRPVIVAMGRGGPPAPQVADPADVGPDRLLELARGGRHAASDYLEDAAFTGLPAVGARRCGGGLAGRAFATNAVEAARTAESLGADLLVLEGSGSSMPPMPWDAGVLVAPAGLPEEHLAGYLGPLRILLADLLLITMASGPSIGPEILTLRSHAERLRPGLGFVVTDFEPVPLGDIQGTTVYLTTTAPGDVARRQADRLQAAAGCRVIGFSANLADRAALREDLAGAPSYEVLVTELKAAAIDVASEDARARGAEIVFLDNRPVARDGQDLAAVLDGIVRTADARHLERR